ncbi:sarcosine oxidase subunit beta family protein [Rhodovarius crocodyli]|uniref:sarcosine oxidase subunit beta family protein n=1 Tax=Rhodovarius crocodyli TaxID=1979269 RepID=UPI001F0B8A13|nr:sarcosine oxidase subunit beta family protein [Rhodovarius crocodyli]
MDIFDPVTAFSFLNLARNALTGHRNWARMWRSPPPQPAYDVVLVGGGGHGLATAYYLAKLHGIRRAAVLEKSWLGGGNTGRNTTMVRSNYLLRPNAMFYEHSLKLWEGLSGELNYNVMFSQRGCITLAHTQSDLTGLMRRGNAMRLNGIDAELLDREALARRLPALDLSPTARLPVLGGLEQPRAGTARHDAVAWGYARAADAMGVDIIQNCEVTGIRREGGRVTGVETTLGFIAAPKVGLCVAGSSGLLGAMAGLRLPIETHVLQAMVSEPVKPVLDAVVASGALHFYASQSDKGELVMGGDIDGHNSYAQRGSPVPLDHAVESCLALFPAFSRLRQLRSWGGLMDMTMDGSPIIAKTPVEGLYLNGGWCYGGFKATPAGGWCFAHTIARDEPHALNAPFSLDRFATGALIDERGAGATPWLH